MVKLNGGRICLLSGWDCLLLESPKNETKNNFSAPLSGKISSRKKNSGIFFARDIFGEEEHETN